MEKMYEKKKSMKPNSKNTKKKKKSVKPNSNIQKRLNQYKN